MTIDDQDDFFLDDVGMTVKEFRLQILKDENEQGMSKHEFFNSTPEWRESIEK